MTSEQTVLNVMARALWDPRPTTNNGAYDDEKAQYLAWALGYPPGWRVVRQVVNVTAAIVEPGSEHNNGQQVKAPDAVIKHENSDTKVDASDPVKNKVTDMANSAEAKKDGTENKPNSENKTGDHGEIKVESSTKTNDNAESFEVKDDKPETKEETVKEEAVKTEENGVENPTNLTMSTDEQSMKQQKQPVHSPSDVTATEDTIYAGHPDSGCDVYFHHEAAMNAAYTCWGRDEDDGELTLKQAAPCYFNKGGHLLKRTPKFQQNDRVQVWYENSWWDAKILRRKEHPEGFKYGVFYPVDHSRQSGIEEQYIRYKITDNDPLSLAKGLGLTAPGWKAYNKGGSHWKIVSPNGTTYTSKKAALQAYQSSGVGSGLNQSQTSQLSQSQNSSAAAEEGDPPWRTTGHDLVGRYIVWTTKHAKSARRTVTIDQIGKVTGWISATDIDQAGQPGYVSDKTNQPAALFHIEFEDITVHPYAALLVTSQDLEEEEVEACLIPDKDLTPAMKKARKK